MSNHVASTGNGRTINNTLRHEYRVLTDAEKASVQEVKDQGAAMLALLETFQPSREVALAKTKIEEAVFWAVKHVTR